ncbi:MAG: thioredoxin domain-containing protein [Turicibacter sp.]|nr:thioredoxin domain-containing protein [Turicibacter sp.]
MSVTYLTEDNFNETVSSRDVPILVDFYADWCGPCKMVSLIAEEIAEETNGKILVCKVDVAKYPKLANSLHVGTVPTVISFKNGSPHKRISRGFSKEAIFELAV